jgi:hypothetical protein
MPAFFGLSTDFRNERIPSRIVFEIHEAFPRFRVGAFHLDLSDDLLRAKLAFRDVIDFLKKRLP